MNVLHTSLRLFGGSLLLGMATVAAAQTTPPVIQGHTGTIALEGTVDQEYAGAHTIVVKTVEGVKHLVHLTGHTTVHGAQRAAGEAASGLEEGSRVVVHYVPEGAEMTAVEIDRVGTDGLHVTEGLVTRVDRGGKKLLIRLQDGSNETLHLTERAAKDIGHDVHRTDRVIVYYTDEAGRRVAHFFKRADK